MSTTATTNRPIVAANDIADSDAYLDFGDVASIVTKPRGERYQKLAAFVGQAVALSNLREHPTRANQFLCDLAYIDSDLTIAVHLPTRTARILAKAFAARPEAKGFYVRVQAGEKRGVVLTSAKA